MAIKAANMVMGPVRKKPAAKPQNRPSLKVGSMRSHGGRTKPSVPAKAPSLNVGSMGSHGGKVKIKVTKPKKKAQRYSGASGSIKAGNVIRTAGKIRPHHKKNVKVEAKPSTDVKMRPWNKRKQGNINNTSYVKTYKSSSYIDDLTKGEDNGTMG